MASRTLTLSLAADIDNLQKGLKKADNEIETFGDKVSAFGKKAAAAFARAYLQRIRLVVFHVASRVGSRGL